MCWARQHRNVACLGLPGKAGVFLVFFSIKRRFSDIGVMLASLPLTPVVEAMSCCRVKWYYAYRKEHGRSSPTYWLRVPETFFLQIIRFVPATPTEWEPLSSASLLGCDSSSACAVTVITNGPFIWLTLENIPPPSSWWHLQPSTALTKVLVILENWFASRGICFLHGRSLGCGPPLKHELLSFGICETSQWKGKALPSLQRAL